MIDVVWLNPSGLDQEMLRDVFDGTTGFSSRHFQFRHVDSLEHIKGDGAVLVVPGAYHEVEDVNRQISTLKWVLVVIVSDENNIFQLGELSHPNTKLWVQTPRVGRDYGNARLFGVGYANARRHAVNCKKYSDVFLSCQNTHNRRREVFDLLDKYQGNRPKVSMHLNRTEGFTQGYSPSEYYRLLEGAKVAPAPSGIVSPDSFRVYEALELGTIPIADDLSPSYDSRGYWKLVTPHTPMPILSDANISDIIDTELREFSWRSNQVFAWWIGKKRQHLTDLEDDLAELTDTDVKRKGITAIIPVSPWKSHPDTAILETTIESIRHHLPSSDIIITFDGVREEQANRFEDYQEFVRKMLWRINTEYTNVLPLVFTKHSHQAKMTREALKHVRTDKIIYVEGDSPLCIDKDINWQAIQKKIDDGVDVVRLYNKAEVPTEHEYLMYPEHSYTEAEVSYVATRQWSQQPHIASVSAYKRILEHFSPEAVCYIEDKIYYVIANEGWDNWKMLIYKDDTPSSYHLDGREGEPKYDDKQTF